MGPEGSRHSHGKRSKAVRTGRAHWPLGRGNCWLLRRDDIGSLTMACLQGRPKRYPAANHGSDLEWEATAAWGEKRQVSTPQTLEHWEHEHFRFQGRGRAGKEPGGLEQSATTNKAHDTTRDLVLALSVNC